ncbi:hypothetical protein PRIPAC_78772 [Pristionchus pacificus]|uniref:Lipase n=1 Tax=Pristionchus pacificus TaxID=54126 RepID=A0A2A6CPS1_PRIPA|nr:hypothetical protein PRIPAC_78772 [Pristionchus pacificus]|eukprot:PDM80194.1 hydrolase [Pristionchus pacificus]
MICFASLFWALLYLVHLSKADDPEAYMGAFDMIKRWDYPAELHDVITADGYILNIFRIRHGRAPQTNATCHRPPVLLVHGLGAGPSEWLLNPPASCPAFILADAGFDVFVLNHRGTTYSKRHITLAPWDNKFSQFTLDELAKYDTPAVIDKVLQITGEQALYMIGHSQGTITGFMTLAENPQYNSKVKALFQLGPIGTGTYSKGIIRALFILYDLLKPVADAYRTVFGSHEIGWQWSFVYRPLVRLCNIIPFGDDICDFATHALFGPSTRVLNMTRAPVYLAHIPNGITTWNGLHWGQLSSRHRIEHMDHNPLENIQRYGQETPTPYNYSLIDVPVYLFWSKSDFLTTPLEVEQVLMKELRPEVVKGSFEVEGYNHIDYVVATDCADTVYLPIAKIVRGRESDMCSQ